MTARTVGTNGAVDYMLEAADGVKEMLQVDHPRIVDATKKVVID